MQVKNAMHSNVQLLFFLLIFAFGILVTKGPYEHDSQPHKLQFPANFEMDRDISRSFTRQMGEFKVLIKTYEGFC